MTARHVPALDGVRGVAILLVLAMHSLAQLHAVGWMAPAVALSRAGWVGVDLFFVLSGYLITGILLETRGAAGYFRSFYARRWLRIWPLYLLALTALTAVSWWAPGLWRADAAWFLREAPWFWSHTVNLRSALWGGIAVNPYGAGTYWSLGVEEQFYLVWPFVVAWIAPRRLAKVCLLLAVGSAVTRTLLLATGTARGVTYTFPLTHLDGLALGSALAAAVRVGLLPAWLRRWGAWLADAPRLVLTYVLMVTGFTFIAQAGHAGAGQTIGLAVGSCWGALVLAAIVTAHADTPLARALSAPWLVWIGVRSYGLYVIHHPVLFCTGRILQAAWPAVPAAFAYGTGVAVSFALAWASWRWWETPWLSLKRYVPRPAPAPAPSRPPPAPAPRA